MTARVSTHSQIIQVTNWSSIDFTTDVGDWIRLQGSDGSKFTIQRIRFDAKHSFQSVWRQKQTPSAYTFVVAFAVDIEDIEAVRVYTAQLQMSNPPSTADSRIGANVKSCDRFRTHKVEISFDVELSGSFTLQYFNSPTSPVAFDITSYDMKNLSKSCRLSARPTLINQSMAFGWSSFRLRSNKVWWWVFCMLICLVKMSMPHSRVHRRKRLPMAPYYALITEDLDFNFDPIFLKSHKFRSKSDSHRPSQTNTSRLGQHHELDRMTCWSIQVAGPNGIIGLLFINRRLYGDPSVYRHRLRLRKWMNCTRWRGFHQWAMGKL